MNDGVLITYTPSLRPIGTIYPVRAINAGFVRHDLGVLTFTIPLESLRWSTAYVRFLNRVEYHHPALPVVWTGVILDYGPPDQGEIQISCASAEWFYTGRFTDLWYIIDNATAGDTVQQLHLQAEARGPLYIGVGALDTSGPGYESEYELDRIADVLTNLAQSTGGDWWVEKTGHELRDPWLLRWSRTRGQDRTDAVFLSGEIVDKPDYKETAGKFASALHVVGGGDGGDIIGINKLYLYIPDPLAIRVYGLVEDRVEYNDIIDPALLEETGKRELARRSAPLRTIGVNVDNRRDAWGTFWLGDTIRMAIAGVGFAGFDGPVVVQGIQFDEDSGKMGLVVELT